MPPRAVEPVADEDVSPFPAWEPITEVPPPKIPNWEAPATSAQAEANWEHSVDPSFRPGIPHAHTPGQRPSRRPSRTVIIVAAVACLLVAVLAATAILTSLHHSTANPGPSGATTPKVSPAPGTNRVGVATAAALTATREAQHGLLSVKGFPTVKKVAAVINPYMSSLQDYKHFLSGLSVPPAALGAERVAAAEVNGDLAFLSTINGLESLHLGTWLVQFGSNTVDLQTALSTFEQVLHVPTS